VGAATYRATAHAIEYADTEPIRVKGKAETVPVWIALRPRPGAARRLTSQSPLVGRTEQLASLHELWDGVVRDRTPGIVTLLGAPGVGKSRLIAAFTEELQDIRGPYRGRCLPYGEGITYWPLAEMVKTVAGISDDDPVTEAVAKLVACCEDEAVADLLGLASGVLQAVKGILVSDDPSAVSEKLGILLDSLPTDDADELRTMASALTNLIGKPATRRGTYGASEIVQAELHWGVRRVFELLATEKPVVLVVEDLHWAEATLLEFMNFVVEGAGAPVFVLTTARPELADSAPEILRVSSNRRTIDLAALDGSDSQALLTGLLGGRGLSAGAAERLLRVCRLTFNAHIIGIGTDSYRLLTTKTLTRRKTA